MFLQAASLDAVLVRLAYLAQCEPRISSLTLAQACSIRPQGGDCPAESKPSLGGLSMTECREQLNHTTENGATGSCHYPVILTTMAGTDIEIAAPVSIHHRWDMLEDFLVENLPLVSHLDTFGCELILMDPRTQEALSDPIQETLWDHTHFHLIVQKCFQTYDHRDQIKGEEYEDYPRAVWVPPNTTGVIPAKAFSSVPRLRRVWVEPSLHTVDREAWRYCYSLQIVKLPNTAVAVEYAAFQGCFALTMVEMCGCVAFGVRLFSECCALAKVGIIKADTSEIAEGAVIGPYAFESCAKLEQLCLPRTSARPVAPIMPPLPEGIPQGCFHSSGIQSVTLGVDAKYIGHRAYENCKQLIKVDISSTSLNTINMHTFSHCTKLMDVSLPPTLQEIQAEAFIGCLALTSVDLPDKIRYIARRAFGECALLSRLHYRRLVRATWRRPYAAHDAFEACFRLALPWWLNYLPPNGDD